MQLWLRKVRVALTPRNWLLKTKLANGALVYGRNRPGYGGRGIYIYRDAIEPEFQHLEKFLVPGGTFLDIGANTGIYTLKAARHLSANGGIVIALEPFPEVLVTLYHNVRANGLANIRLRNLCAGERTHATRFWMNFGRPNSFSIAKRDDGAMSFSTLVVTVDELAEWEGLSRLDYLKIDVEGVEAQVLAGARKTISRFRPIIQVEVSINNVPVELPEYSAFQAGTGPNRIFIPNESTKIDVPKTLGWSRLEKYNP
ncbi:MAG TPA: FkbM family methyltransferase [Candidatus Acidoferrales bacterium]|jgi:FkbM family methyltransferase|nr:FkbM family methyltransferase [Candidatus Acidoferrales bacterium]